MLTLLHDVAFDGRPVTGERTHALLARLAGEEGRSVSEDELVAAVWDDQPPAHPAKALQVVVSRTRAQTASEAIERTGAGYRLAVGTDLDALRERLARARHSERDGDAAGAEAAAREAIALTIAGGDDDTELGQLRVVGRALRAEAGTCLGRVLSATGAHAEALGLLQDAAGPDEATMAALLRSTRAVHGAPAALARFEEYRSWLADSLGVDPSPELQRLHSELLSADNPVRSGLHYEATSLVGRDDTMRALRAVVAESRVTSILGPGGLGKTRLAHLLGHEASEPVVHFVELAGVLAGDDVLGEVGSALGVRDSVSGRRHLSLAERTDVRGRIAQHLDQVPTLLILDNCEHVIEAVADLVAVLVSQTRHLRVVTTTRAPLAIAAERVYALQTLSADDAAELFRQRAEAARPGVRLDEDAVRGVVARLDGVPLAIELAAAKVRAMSVADIERRLDDRFALLQGRDRGAPDRHQTLLAVIEWSWLLLSEDDQRALARLSTFPDGFSLGGAEALVGPTALSALESLAAQSLLTVRDTDRGLRYRMLEMVREFGALKLNESADGATAREALRAWGVGVAASQIVPIYGDGQIESVRVLVAEENNLADLLRVAMTERDRESMVILMAALGGLWTVRGEHARVIALVRAFDEALAGWEPEPEHHAVTARACATVAMNGLLGGGAFPEHCRTLLDTCAPAADPGLQALAAILAAERRGAAVEEFLDSPDRHVAMVALQWASHERENTGDLDGALTASLAALQRWEESDGVWVRALHQTQVAGLFAQVGRLEEAAAFAREGIPVLDALQADDDAIQLRALLALQAIAQGDLEAATGLAAQMSARHRPGMWASAAVLDSTHAELALAEGRIAEGLARYEGAVAACEALTFPGRSANTGLEPWTLHAQSCAVAAHAQHGGHGSGERLYRDLAAKAIRLAEADEARLDYPILGTVIFAVGLWGLLRDDRGRAAVELLGLAERCGYNRYAPSMAWARAADAAEAAVPGVLATAHAALGERRGPDVLDDVRTAVRVW